MTTLSDTDRQLIDLMLDDDLPDKECEALLQRLEDDPEAIAYLAERATLHAYLGELTRRQSMTQTAVASALHPTPAKPPVIRILFGLAAAAAIALAFMVFPESPPAQQNAAAIKQPATTYVATLRGSVGCVWQSSPLQLNDGARIPVGHYQLSRGQAEMVFDSGVRLLVEGPAEFEVTGPESALVDQGRIVFDDGGGSQPFRLSTKTATLVDIGTHYALSVTGDHEDLHVFEGAVELNSNNQKTLIKKGQAVRYSGRTSNEPIALAADNFVLQLPDADSTGELLAAEPFDYHTELNDADSGHGWGTPKWTARDKLAGKWTKVSTHYGALAVTHGKDVSIRRNLERPLNLAQDGVCYVSLVVKSPHPIFFLIIRSEPSELGDIEPGVRFGMHGNTVISHFQDSERRTAVPLVPSETYRVVCKIVASADHNDQTFVHISQQSASATPFEPESWTTASSETDSEGLLKRVSLDVATRTHDCQIDDVRIGTSWAAVTRPVSKQED